MQPTNTTTEANTTEANTTEAGIIDNRLQTISDLWCQMTPCQQNKLMYKALWFYAMNKLKGLYPAFVRAMKIH